MVADREAKWREDRDKLWRKAEYREQAGVCELSSDVRVLVELGSWGEQRGLLLGRHDAQ